MDNRIKELREKRGLTEKEVAEYLGCKVGTYKRYESGERRIPTPKFVKLAYLYDVSVDYLADLTDETALYERVPYEEWRKNNE